MKAQEYDFCQYENYRQMKKNYAAEYGLNIGGWIYAGWIKYENGKHRIATFDELVASSLTTDHGELRIAVPREDERGVNCFWKEKE